MRGTLPSYMSLFVNQVRIRQRLATSTTWVLLLYILFSIFGRFGIAFLGFAFNFGETLHYAPPLFRPNWADGIVESDDTLGMEYSSQWSSILISAPLVVAS